MAYRLEENFLAGAPRLDRFLWGWAVRRLIINHAKLYQHAVRRYDDEQSGGIYMISQLWFFPMYLAAIGAFFYAIATNGDVGPYIWAFFLPALVFWGLAVSRARSVREHDLVWQRKKGKMPSDT